MCTLVDKPTPFYKYTLAPTANIAIVFVLKNAICTKWIGGAGINRVLAL